MTLFFLILSMILYFVMGCFTAGQAHDLESRGSFFVWCGIFWPIFWIVGIICIIAEFCFNKGKEW